MRTSFRIGTFRGIAVGANWSVVWIAALLAFGLAYGQFPQEFPHRATLVYVLAGTVAAMLFFVSLLAHELAHAVVARRAGMEVDGVTLWLFGGVARLEGDAPTPGADFRIAGVGPLVSILLAVVFTALGFGMVHVASLELPGAVFRWLGVINGLLAVFNLLPGAPLDGGRLLRAALWWRWRDRTRAALAATRVGRGVGIVVVGIGLVEFFLGSAFSGVWLALIGWFLASAAAAEAQAVAVHAALDHVLVRDVMHPVPVLVPDWTTVEEFIETYALAYRESAFALVDFAGAPAGLVLVGQARLVAPEARRTVRVREIACSADVVPTAWPEELVTELLPQLEGCAEGRALVVEAGVVIGVVSPGDITQALDRRGVHTASRPRAWTGSAS